MAGIKLAVRLMVIGTVHETAERECGGDEAED